MINETIGLLGFRALDKVTGFTGTISSVSFDLYGCVQAVLTPEMGVDGKMGESHWFDVQRLVLSEDRVITPRDFDADESAPQAKRPDSYDRGPAEKPAVSTIAK